MTETTAGMKGDARKLREKAKDAAHTVNVNIPRPTVRTTKTEKRNGTSTTTTRQISGVGLVRPKKL